MLLSASIICFTCMYFIYPMIIMSRVCMMSAFQAINLDPSETFRLRTPEPSIGVKMVVQELQRQCR